jgi:hypothetical protein
MKDFTHGSDCTRSRQRKLEFPSAWKFFEDAEGIFSDVFSSKAYGRNILRLEAFFIFTFSVGSG